MDTREEIGKRIYELRRYFRITQKELCEGICTQAYISKIENGSLAIAADILFQISERLGVDINYFYDSTYNARVDYSLEVELQARELVEHDDYRGLERLIAREEKTPLMENKNFKQFILWHKALCKRELDKDYDEALKLLNQALDLCKTSSKVRSEREIKIIISKANLYSYMGNQVKAMEFYDEAKDYITNRPFIQDKNLSIMLYYNLARLNYMIEDYEKTIELANEGIYLCKKNQSLYGFGQLYFILGSTYREIHELELALENFKKASLTLELIGHELLLNKTLQIIDIMNDSVLK